MTEPTRDKSNSVTVAYVCQNTVVYSWHRSMIEMMGYDTANNQRVMHGGFLAIRYGTDGMTEARNKAVRTFLDECQADWMLWIDTDMGFAADTVDRLFEAADAATRPVVGGLCFSQREDDSDGVGGYRWTATPTIYDWTTTENGQQGWVNRWDYPTNTLTPVAGTGSACILIHRSVFERIEKEHGQVWYDRVFNTTTGQLVGEDLSFCLRVGALNIPMFVHTGVATTHFKPIWLSEADYWLQRSVNSAAEEFAKVASEPEQAVVAAELLL